MSDVLYDWEICAAPVCPPRCTGGSACLHPRPRSDELRLSRHFPGEMQNPHAVESVIEYDDMGTYYEPDPPTDRKKTP